MKDQVTLKVFGKGSERENCSLVKFNLDDLDNI